MFERFQWAIAGSLILCAPLVDAESRLASYGSPYPQAQPVTAEEVRIPPARRMDEPDPGSFIEGNPDVQLSINLPAFQIVVWQQGRQIQKYPIGIAQRKFPMPVGVTKANEVIWNPPWIPPERDWVFDRPNVRPGEYIPPGDKRNPLGKIKIPLGKGFLIHQAKSSSDIGGLVSHGCIRMMKADLEDLAAKIVSARSLASSDKISEAEQTLKTLYVKVSPPLLVSVTYDTIVVENGELRIYPDIYGRGTNTPDNLRAELLQANVDFSLLTDAALAKMLARAQKSQAFIVAIEDIKNGDALERGFPQPLRLTELSSR